MPSWCYVAMPNFISPKILGWEIELGPWVERIISKGVYFKFLFYPVFRSLSSLRMWNSFWTFVCDAFLPSKAIEIRDDLDCFKVWSKTAVIVLLWEPALERDVPMNWEAKYGLRARLLEEFGCYFCVFISRKPVILGMMFVYFCWSANGEGQGVVSNNTKGIIYVTWKCLDLGAFVQNTHDWKMQC